MINGLDIPSYNLEMGNGLYLTGTTLRGKGCDIKCNKKRTVKKQTASELQILKKYFLLTYNYARHANIKKCI